MRQLLLALLLFAGCATGSTPRATWLELRSTRFVLTTDLPPEAARQAFRTLEELWAALADQYKLLAPDMAAPTLPPLEVVHFKHCFSLSEAGGEQGMRAASRDFAGGDRYFYCGEAPEDVAAEPLRIVIAYQFNKRFFGNHPFWLQVGLALFTGTLRVADGKVYLGEPPEMLLGQITSAMNVPSPGELRSLRLGESFDRYRMISSWMLVHVLVTSSPDYLRRFVYYLGLLRDPKVDEKEAWRLAFGGVPAGEIDAKHAGYVERRDFPRLSKGWSPAPLEEPAVRQLRPGEAHVLWIYAHLRGLDYQKHDAAEIRSKVEARLAEMAKSDPTWSDAPYWRIVADLALMGSKPDRTKIVAALEAYRAQAPDDDRPLAGIVALTLDDLAGTDVGADPPRPPPARLAALAPHVEVLAGRARTAWHLSFVARYYLLAGKPDVAVTFANRALALDRACTPCLSIASAIEHARGHDDLAGDLLLRAILSTDETPAPEVLKRLDQYRRSTAAR